MTFRSHQDVLLRRARRLGRAQVVAWIVALGLGLVGAQLLRDGVGVDFADVHVPKPLVPQLLANGVAVGNSSHWLGPFAETLGFALRMVALASWGLMLAFVFRLRFLLAFVCLAAGLGLLWGAIAIGAYTPYKQAPAGAFADTGSVVAAMSRAPAVHAEGDALNALVGSPESYERGARLYVAAQLAYVRHDPARTARFLAAFNDQPFPDSVTTVGRVRRMWNYVVASGQPLPPGYRPRLAAPTALLLLAGRIVLGAAAVTLLFAALLTGVAHSLNGRLDRIAAMLDTLKRPRAPLQPNPHLAAR